MNLTECTVEPKKQGWDDQQEQASDQPVLLVHVDDTTDQLLDRLATPNGDPLPNDSLDVTFRYHMGAGDNGLTGIFAVSDNVTGRFVLEGRVDAVDIQEFVSIAREYGNETGGAAYRLKIHHGGVVAGEYDMEVLLVFDADDTLLRQQSLIPNNIEV